MTLLKKILLWGGVALFVLLAVDAWLYKQKLIKAELTNQAIKKQVELLTVQNTDIIAASKKFVKEKNEEVNANNESANKKLTAANVIITRTAGQVFAIRNEKTSIEDKYNKLEDDALEKGKKIILLEGAIVDKDNQIANFNDLIDNPEKGFKKTIADLNFSINDPEKGYKALLEKSIKNTDSIIRKPFILRIFGRISVVVGAGVGADGKIRPSIAAGVRII